MRSVHEASSPSYPELGFKSMKRQEVLMFLLDRIGLSLISSSLLLFSDAEGKHRLPVSSEVFGEPSQRIPGAQVATETCLN